MSRRERRLRLRHNPSVPEGQARMNPQTMKELGIESRIEVVIAGKKKFLFNVLPNDGVPPNEVWCNEDELRSRGVADRTIATVRAAKG